MMRNRYSGLLAIVLTSSICANAQSIDGKVMENDSIPVPYATVSLLQASDSAYVAGVIGGEDGSPDKPGGLSIQLCKSEKKEFYIRYSS